MKTQEYKVKQKEVRCGGYGWPSFHGVRISRKGSLFGDIDSATIKRRVNRTIRRKQRQEVFAEF